MKDQTIRRSLRGAIYTRVSTEQGLEQDFNSLDAQREACEAYIKSQAHECWRLIMLSRRCRPPAASRPSQRTASTRRKGPLEKTTTSPLTARTRPTTRSARAAI